MGKNKMAPVVGEEEEEEEVDEVAEDGESGGTGNEDEQGDGNEEEIPLVHLPEYVVKRVEKLKELDESRDKIMDQYMKERSNLEKKFSALLKPLYENRVSIVAGERDSEIAAATGISPQPEEGEEVIMKGIPHFWSTAISNHDTTGELITEEDVDCLEHLRDITCADDEDGKGFTISFLFRPNDYFSDTVLTKRYEVPNLLLSDEPVIKQVHGCIIHWKEDRSLTFRKFQKKQRGKGKKAGQIRTVTKTEKKESFFHWFEAPQMPTSVDNMDEEEVEHYEELFGDDFDVAQAFRCEICPRAVQWYTGEAAEREMLEMMSEVAENGQG